MNPKADHTIRILPDLESLSRAAAELIVTRSETAIESAGLFSLVLSGGSTPRRTYQLLASEPFKQSIPWEKTYIFWGDERCVAPDDERSNERTARDALLNYVPIPPEQIHPIRCAGSPQRAADAYESRLRSFFGSRDPVFDVALMGMGEDGHTASLFPGTSVLKENKKWVSVSNSGRDDFDRVTLTLPIINRSSLIIFLVSGKQKAAVFHEVTARETTQRSLPARLIHPTHGKLIWLVDKEASGIR